MTTKNFNDVTVEKYVKDCTALIKYEGYGAATNSMEKTEMKRVMDSITDWNDLDQLYDACTKVQNIIFKYDKLSMSNKRWAERELQIRQHYTDMVQLQFNGITNEDAEHEEYQELFVKWGMMKTKNDGFYSFAHLDVFKTTEMFFEMCKIRAHWLEKVEAGQYARKFFGISYF